MTRIRNSKGKTKTIRKRQALIRVKAFPKSMQRRIRNGTSMIARKRDSKGRFTA